MVQERGKEPGSALDTLLGQGAIGKTEPAKAAASNTSFPTQMLVKFDSASIFSLQPIEFKTDADGKPIGINATDEFLAYMEKTPEERMRANILKSLGVTEEELESLPPEQRQAIEDKIKEMIKDRIRPASELGLPSGETLNKRMGWAEMVRTGLVTPATSASPLSIGMLDDVLAAAGYKPPEKQ